MVGSKSVWWSDLGMFGGWIYGCLVVRSRNVWWLDLRVSGGQI